MRSRRQRRQAGISMTEVLLVMALFVMAIVSIPNLNGFMHVLKARTAVNEMVAALNMARQLSVRVREGHVFVPVAGDVHRWELHNLATGQVVRGGELPHGVTHDVLAAFQFDEKGQCVNPTTYVSGEPATQYLRVRATLQSGTVALYTMTISPISRVQTTTEHLSS